MSDLVIAIDGPAGSGKSTVARGVARELGWSFLDTGAMYRAVTVAALAAGLSPDDDASVAALAREVAIETLPRVTVDGRDVESEIRSDDVNEAVSVVAANPDVRASMVARQREFARAQPAGTVVEGRDITTVVFPDATLKVFLTASLAVRAERRGADEDESSLARRDAIDSSREASPLRRADDALTIDTTERDVDDVIKEIVTCLKTKTSS